MVHVVAVGGLRGAAMAAPVVRDNPIALLKKEEHLCVPVVRRQRPAVAEHDRLPLTPVLVVDLDSIAGCDHWHGQCLLTSWRPPARSQFKMALPLPYLRHAGFDLLDEPDDETAQVDRRLVADRTLKNTSVSSRTAINNHDTMRAISPASRPAIASRA